MSNVIEQFIAGKVCSNTKGRRYPVYNPALGEKIRDVCFATSEEVDAAIVAANQAFHSWKKVTPLKRARILFKFRELLEQHHDELAQLLTNEHGKVLNDAQGEVMRGIELVEYMCGIPALLKGNYSQNVGTEIDCYTVRQPLGVCVGITPFNFPVMISCWMFVPAIACGNTFVLKPSEKAPSAPVLLAKLMQKAGLPDGVLNIVHGDKTVVDQLITHPDVRAVSCVGSSPVAKSIYLTAVQHGKRAHTFGGAKNHCVVMPDCNLANTANAILGAAYGAAGERCMAVPVAVTLGEEVANTLVAHLQQQIQKLKIGPGEGNPDVGPLVTKEHWQRTKSYIDLGVQEGAKLMVDGRDFTHGQGFFMGPCLFDFVKPSMRIYQEEIFGPVLMIMRVKTLEEAIELINQHSYGNGTAIFTHQGEFARRFADEIEVGMVGINVPIPVPVAYHTFGGWKNSLFGDLHMHGPESILFYTRSKSVTVRWPRQLAEEINYHMPTH